MINEPLSYPSDSLEQQCLELGIDLLTLGLIPPDENSTKRTVLNKPWLLHVEDDHDFSETFRLRMELEGFHVVRASSGVRGMEAVFEHPAEAVIVDYRLPNGMGDFLLRRLKAHPVTTSIPVYFLSGEVNVDLEQELLMLGASGVFRKPPNYARLVSCLRECTTATRKPRQPVGV